jgi:hypothetical protein
MVYNRTRIAVSVGETLRQQYALLPTELDERRRRLWAASEAYALGHGGVAAVAKATGLAESTIRLGQRELRHGSAAVPSLASPHRVRHPGGGRPPRTTHDPSGVRALDALVDPPTRGAPMSPLRWTCKSTRKLAAELTQQGYRLSHTTVAHRRKALGYRLHSTRQTKEGSAHPDRNAQCEDIHHQMAACQRRGQPVVSVEAQTKALGGDWAHAGRAYRPSGQPETVRGYDCIDKELGRAIP